MSSRNRSTYRKAKPDFHFPDGTAEALRPEVKPPEGGEQPPTHEQPSSPGEAPQTAVEPKGKRDKVSAEPASGVALGQEALEQLQAAWKKAGPGARRQFLAEVMDELLTP